MRHFNSTIVSWVFALGAAPAYATFPTCDRYCQDPDITTTVLRQQDSVTLSTPALTTLATYRITVTHYATRDEALRPVFVDLATGVVAPDGVTPVSPAQSARIVSSSLPAALGACIALPSTAIRCTINNGLSAAGESIAFVVTVEAPQAGATPIAGNQIRLTADTTWKEPDEGPTVLEREPQRVALTPLDIPETTRAKSFVQPGGSLFTVNDQCVRSNEYIGCAATVQDPWTTTVTVTQGNTLVEIKESVDTLGCARAANLLDCRESSITLRG